MAFPTQFANLTNATGAQLDGNFNALSANSGSSLVGFIQSGTGAVSETIQDKARERITPKDFGADLTGVNDSTASVVNALASTTQSIELSAGTYKLTGSIQGKYVSKGGVITSGGNFGGFVGGVQSVVQTATTSSDYATLGVTRATTHSGGTIGNVNSGIHLDHVVGTGVTNFEWGIVSVLTNNATSASTQNVAIYGQGNKNTGAGPTWGAVMEAHDRSGLANPTTGLIGLEVDVFADGLDTNLRRVGVDIVGGQGVLSAPVITYGLRIGPVFGNAANCSFSNGAYLYGNMNRAVVLAHSGVVGIDTSGATLTGASLRMAQDQFISFDNTDIHKLSWVSAASTLEYITGSGIVFSVTDAGTLSLNGKLSVITNTTDTFFDNVSANPFHFRTNEGVAAVEQVRILHTASATNYLTLTGSNGGNPTIATSAGNLAITPAVIASNSVLSNNATAGIGYSTGAGGTVTQITSRTTGVTLNKISGQITLVSAAGTATPQSFVVTNSVVAATDIININQASGTDLYEIFVTNVAPGSFKITFFTTGGTTTEQPVFNFAVLKAVAA